MYHRTERRRAALADRSLPALPASAPASRLLVTPTHAFVLRDRRSAAPAAHESPGFAMQGESRR